MTCLPSAAPSGLGDRPPTRAPSFLLKCSGHVSPGSKRDAVFSAPQPLPTFPDLRVAVSNPIRETRTRCGVIMPQLRVSSVSQSGPRRVCDFSAPQLLPTFVDLHAVFSIRETRTRCKTTMPRLHVFCTSQTGCLCGTFPPRCIAISTCTLVLEQHMHASAACAEQRHLASLCCLHLRTLGAPACLPVLSGIGSMAFAPRHAMVDANLHLHEPPVAAARVVATESIPGGLSSHLICETNWRRLVATEPCSFFGHVMDVMSRLVMGRNIHDISDTSHDKSCHAHPC